MASSMISTALKPYLQWLARRRLQRIVDQAAQSPATIEYRIRRAAAKAGWRKRKGLSA